MANKNTIGCSAGRAKIIDPNDFDGFESSTNVPVQLEDLNISVKLTSFRKGRTLLTKNEEGGKKENVSQISVNFIEGSNLGGKKVLTTSYTDLTTSFDADVVNDETLGITNIEIEFNASMAPLITINFIDVRGSSIFQNEENILNNRGNKYTTFFQLPYPMYELEVKGYYGLPVKYCLHMLKFNSKFNSQTGNFEITANFIGYTFALMADMLIGYLKAIPFTTIGKERMRIYNSTISSGIPVLTLSDLTVAISKLSDGFEKEKDTNPASKEIGAADKGIELLDDIKFLINDLGSTNFDLRKDKDEYEYIIYAYAADYTPEQKNQLTNVYIKNVKEKIKEYNDLIPPKKLEESHFVNIESNTNKGGGKKYVDIKFGNLKNNDEETNESLGNPSEGEYLKQKIVNYVNEKYKSINDSNHLNIFDMTLLYETLAKARTAVEVRQEESKKTLARAFEGKVRDTLGFDPTARTIIECFTAAIEVFVETIFTVSLEATNSSDRTDELSKKFNTSDTQMTDMKNVYIEKKLFFPWPDYRHRDDAKKTYVDKYLGAPNVLESPERVTELRFIDDLLKAFRLSKKADNNALAAQELNETTWTSVSPIDTLIFQKDEPYKRLAGPDNTELLTKEDATRLMLIRGMTFLAHANDYVFFSDEEIKAMAAAEVDNFLRGIKDDVVRQSMTNLNLQYFLNITGEIDGKTRKVVLPYNDTIYYDYFFSDTPGVDSIDGSSLKIIPTNLGFHKNTNYWKDGDSVEKFRENLRKLRDEKGYLFLTNYNDTEYYKADRGGIDVRILTDLPSPIGIGYVPEGLKTTETTMILANLIGDPEDPTSVATLQDAGYNCFNPNYGIQEYDKMDWGNDDLKGLPLMYVFYQNSDIGLAYTRKKTGAIYKSKFDSTSPYFYKGKKFITYPSEKIEAYQSYTEYDGDSYIGTDNAPMHEALGKNRELFNRLLQGGEREDITYPYIEMRFGEPKSGSFLGFDYAPEGRDAYDSKSFSLFGSEFYYNQSYAYITKEDGTKISCSEYSKAFLFLHTFPFNTTVMAPDPFLKNEIRHLFDVKAGIIHAPKLWCIYIGALLWRMNDNDPVVDSDGKITGGGVGKYSFDTNKITYATLKGDPIVWAVDYSNDDINGWNPTYDYKLFDVPDIKDEYFPFFLDYTRNVGDGERHDYRDIGIKDTLKTLPVQVKSEFRKMFFEFVNGTGNKSWRGLADKLEIFNTSSMYSGKKFKNYLDEIKSISSGKLTYDNLIKGDFGGTTYNVNEDNITNNYDIITPIDDIVHGFYLFLELKDKMPVVNSIIELMTEEAFIINNNWKIWRGGLSTNLSSVDNLYVHQDTFKLYFTEISDIFKRDKDKYNVSKQNENLDEEIFGTTNKDVIRLQLYRHCKNIYDKWLGGAKDVDHLVFQCGNGTRSTVDDSLAKRYQNSKTRMIDSFRFVTRSFRDIGNELYINPTPINDYLLDNPNSSSYDAISSILSSNNFNFQALPNFVNFHDDTILESIFKPYNYNDKEIPLNSCGPAFVCVYDGQGSKHLELTERDGDYPNDGFDLRCMQGEKNKGSLDVSVPTDFTTELNGFEIVGADGVAKKQYYEEPVSTFMVRYSQQNQNIFKDIHLDQSEFAETDESIQIQDEISQKGAEKSLIGQNVYNVYAVRSYTAQVEMMGNAMIQPMMYFQLDNIPMFHGAYMITKVSHSIKANSMSTNFTGTRIRYPETPLIEAYEVYMDLVESMDISDSGDGTIGSGSGGGGAISGKFAAIIGTIIDNDGRNGSIESGYIKTAPLPKLEGVMNMKLNEKKNNKLLVEAIEPFKLMMKEYVKWLIDEGYPGSLGNQIIITSMFRDYEKQVQVANQYKNQPGRAAIPGSSPHGWGIAIDLQFYDKKGRIVDNTENIPEFFKFEKNPAIKWFYDNSYRFGFINPVSLRDGKGKLDEHWHIEYHGTCAKEILSKNPTIYGYTVTVDKPIDASVKNPKTPQGVEAVYTNCSNVTIKKTNTGDGSEGGKIVEKVGCPPLVTKGGERYESKVMYNKIKTLTKLSDIAIGGIMGSLYRESNFTPQAFNTNSNCGVYGLVQWLGNRLIQMGARAKETNRKIEDVDFQLEYMWAELTDNTIKYPTWKYTLAALKNAKNIDEAAKIFGLTYESGNLGAIDFNVGKITSAYMDPKRLNLARKFYKMIETKTFVNLTE